MNDHPYSTLKQNERTYQMLLLHDQHGLTLTEIAKIFKITPERVKQLYHKLKLEQVHLYINHLAAVLEADSASQVQNVLCAAYECYQDWTYVCAYLEKKYKVILKEYRNGEPGMPTAFIRTMSPFKPKLSEETVARVVQLREVQKATFKAIAKELHLTQAKAKDTYDKFYHKKSLALVHALQEKAASEEEKNAIWAYYFRGCHSPKKRYDILTQDESIIDAAQPPKR